MGKASRLKPMRHNHPHRMRMVGLDVEDVGLAKKAGKLEVVFAAVPLATNPADAVHVPHCRQFGDD